MIEDRPKDSDDDKVVLVSLEFGTNILPRSIAKARVIRDFVNPAATLVIQPNSIIGEPNMNFSWAERRRLSDGDLQPIIGRIAIAMGAVGDSEDVTIFGSSQGAMVALGYAAHKDTPSAVVSAVEIPNVVERRSGQLIADFMRSGRDLPRVVEANFTNHESSPASLVERDAISKRSFARYVLLSLHPDNIAMFGAMCHATEIIPTIKSVLDKGGSVVHAWGDQDNVSPEYMNKYIASIFKDNPRYASRELQSLSHAATDFYALDGALARLAHNLKIK
jgi:pimeloyl-ACP methyl ester carboxylesterase